VLRCSCVHIVQIQTSVLNCFPNRLRNLLNLSGKPEVTPTPVVMTLDKRAHNPYLVASGLADQPTLIRWFGDKKLIIRFA
jgi:hypothetical protein